jgi:hypothetical protein
MFQRKEKFLLVRRIDEGVLWDSTVGLYVLDGRIILRLIFRKWDVGVWSGSSWLRIGRGGGHL